MSFEHFITDYQVKNDIMPEYLNSVDWALIRSCSRLLREKIGPKCACKCPRCNWREEVEFGPKNILIHGYFGLYNHLLAGGHISLINTNIMDYCYIAAGPLDFGHQTQVLDRYINFHSDIAGDIYLAMTTYNNLGLVKWAITTYGVWPECFIEYVASQGDISLIIWAREMGLPSTKIVIAAAAQTCSLEYIKWLYDNNFPLSKRASKMSAFNDDENVLKWLHSVGCPKSNGVIRYLIIKEKYELIKWARSVGFQWDDHASSNLAGNGNLDMLKWAIANGCPINGDMCEYAAMKRYYEILKWVVYEKIIVSFSYRVCYLIAKNGDYDVLKWAYENGLPWNERVSTELFEKKQYKVLAWALEEGCPLSRILMGDIGREGLFELLLKIKDLPKKLPF